MLEIYNEQVHDLLDTGPRKKGGMKVRNHPKKGFYVDGLVVTPVSSYVAIDNKINEGTSNRTVACTQMNATSSRAHTIVTILFSQKNKDASGQSMTKTASINLVDLAGSERAESTGATGDRLKEGSAINQSLSSLGNVISALAEASKGGSTKLVPYRNSVLTMLLKNALAGNSKTIMCAALSPADINYEETLSTLRFADRAKQIKTKAVVNESPTEKLIRELREENARLMEMMKGGAVPTNMPALPGQSGAPAAVSEDAQAKIDKAEAEAAAKLKQQLEQNAKEMELMQQSFEERLKEAELKKQADEEAQRAATEAKKNSPHLWNMSDDPALQGMVCHFIKEGLTVIGTKKGKPAPDIIMGGMGIKSEHATLNYADGEISLTRASNSAKLTINGKPIVSMDKEQQPIPLKHHDRVLLGASQLFCLEHPTQRDAGLADGMEFVTPTYEDAQDEIAAASGLTSGSKGGKGEALQDELVTMMPHVNEANAISQELNKKCFFEVVLTADHTVGEVAVDKDEKAAAKVNVKVHDLLRGISWLWSRSTFLNRKYIMQEMYQHFNNEDEWERPQEEDPFWEPIQHQVIASSFLYLSSLSHMIDVEEDLSLTDLQGREQGLLRAKVDLCNAKGVILPEEEAEDMFVDEPEELLKKPAHFLLTLCDVKGIPRNSTDEVYCSFQFMDEPVVETQKISGKTNPTFNHAHHIDIPLVNHDHLEYFESKAIKIIVHGKRIPEPNPGASEMSTMDLINQFRRGPADGTGDANERLRRRSTAFAQPLPGQSLLDVQGPPQLEMTDEEREKQVDQQAALHRMHNELDIAKRHGSRMAAKLARVERLVKAAEATKNGTVARKDLEIALHPQAAKRKWRGLGSSILLMNRAANMTKALKAGGKRFAAGDVPAAEGAVVGAPEDGSAKSEACSVQ
jgi:hypothetical protein